MASSRNMVLEKSVIDHYERDGLAESILEQARAVAADPQKLTAGDLSGFDEMHIGGRQATEYLAKAMTLRPGMRVIDIGSGLGGPARYMASHYDVDVTGIDLTPGYKDAADALSAAVGMTRSTAFVTGNALSMPFADEIFDAAMTIHAAMNIQDKAGLYRQAHRVLKPGACFAIYDVMAVMDNPALMFPLPWADGQQSSFLITPVAAEEMLRLAGFEILSSESRRDFGLAALEKMFERPAAQMKIRRADFMARAKNLLGNIRGGLCAPWQIACRKIS